MLILLLSSFLQLLPNGSHLRGRHVGAGEDGVPQLRAAPAVRGAPHLVLVPPRVHAAQPHAQRDTQRAEQLEVAEVVGQELDEALLLGFFNIDIDIYTVNTKYFCFLNPSLKSFLKCESTNRQ